MRNLSFDAKRPVSEELAELGLHPVQGENALSDLLLQLRGIPFRLLTGSGEQSGVLVGTEEREEASGETTIAVGYLLLLKEDDAIVPIRLSDIISLHPDEERAQRDLRRLLEAGLYWKNTERKKLIIQPGNAKQMRLSYMLPVPVWKSSYRILLSENDRCMMQAWALVHNTSEEDWNDVQLSLASGLPISFRMDLYTPRIRHRPIAELSEKEEYAAPLVGRSYAEPPVSAAPAMSPPAPEARTMRMAAAGMARMDDEVELAALEPSVDFESEEAFTASSSGRSHVSEFAEMSLFEIRESVRIPAGKSSLVPLFTVEAEGKRVALYRPSIRTQNPMTAILFRNMAGFALEEGPITFYTPDGYTGESILPVLRKDEEVIVPFAIETGMLIDTRQKSETFAVHRVYARSGLVFFERKIVSHTVYMIRRAGLMSFDQLFIDHPERPGWTITGNRPLSRSEGFVRFCTSAEQNEFEVVEERVISETMHMQTGTEWLDVVSATGLVKSTEASALSGIAALNRRITEANRSEERSEAAVEEIDADQKRIRENLKALGQAEEERALRRRYVTELEAGEDRLKSLRSELNAIRKERDALTADRNARIDSLSFDFFVDGT